MSDAAKSTHNPRVSLLLIVFFVVMYGAYYVGHQNGRNQGIKEVVKYNICTSYPTTISNSDECWEKEVTNHGN